MNISKKQLTNLNRFRTSTLPEDQHLYVDNVYFTCFAIENNKFETPVYYRIKHGLKDVTGPAFIPVSDFVKIAKKQNVLSIEPAGRTGRANVITDSGVFTLGGGDADLIKQAPDILGTTGVTLETAELNKLAKFSSSDDLRPAMQGIYIDGRAGKLVSTCGHRLKWQEIKAPADMEIIIPAGVVSLLTEKEYNLHNCAEWNGPQSGEFYALVSESETIIFKAIHEGYPNWRSVVPRESKATYTISLDIKEALKVCDAAKVVANSTSHQIRLQPKESGIILRAEDLDTSQHYESNQIGTFEIEPDADSFDVGFNVDYLIETLKDQKDAEQLVLKIASRNRAAIFNSTGLLMPVMLNSYA